MGLSPVSDKTLGLKGGESVEKSGGNSQPDKSLGQFEPNGAPGILAQARLLQRGQAAYPTGNRLYHSLSIVLYDRVLH